MADAIHDLLAPSLPSDLAQADALAKTTASNYLSRLSTLSISALTGSEQEALEHEASSVLRSIQALSKRSYKSINTSVQALEALNESLPSIVENANLLQTRLPHLDTASTKFAQKYARDVENQLLDRRNKAMGLAQNVDRLSDILELPTLLASTISSSGAGAAGGSTLTTSTSTGTAGYTSALDLYVHVKRLRRLYPNSEIIGAILVQAEEAMQDMTTNIISSLRSQSLKLAGGMRLIGLLRRIAPDLDSHGRSSAQPSVGTNEGSLGALFLVCRLGNLMNLVEALDPLRSLADQEAETIKSRGGGDERSAWAAGQQTERYLKRYIEVFREQCFAMVSMYKSIFSASLPAPRALASEEDDGKEDEKGDRVDGPVEDEMQILPAALSTFSLFVADLLLDNLRQYLPNVRDRGSRDSLLTQVLYCSASLGRLGGDFGMMISLLEDAAEEVASLEKGETLKAPEWVHVVRKHRVQAGRLELLASGVRLKSSTTNSRGQEV